MLPTFMPFTKFLQQLSLLLWISPIGKLAALSFNQIKLYYSSDYFGSSTEIYSFQQKTKKQVWYFSANT